MSTQTSRRRRARGALLFALVFWPRVARADDCSPPDLLESTPAAGAEGVPTDASLIARYATTADHLDEPVYLEDVGTSQPAADRKATTDAPPPTWVASEGTLSIKPGAPLVPGHWYVVTWPGLRGINASNRGHGGSFAFRVGTGPDVTPPHLDALGPIHWDTERSTDSCTDSVTERFVFDLSLGNVDDDGGRDNLTLLVFQTAGTPDAGSARPILVTRIPKKGDPVRVVSAIERGVGRTCFAVLARDLTGKVSSGAVEACTDTVAPPYFYGCGLGRSRDGAWTLGLLSLLGLARVVRRR